MRDVICPKMIELRHNSAESRGIATLCRISEEPCRYLRINKDVEFKTTRKLNYYKKWVPQIKITISCRKRHQTMDLI